MICDEHDYYYRVTFYRYRGAARVKVYRYFDTLPDAWQFAHNADGHVSRVIRTTTEVILSGGNLYGKT